MLCFSMTPVLEVVRDITLAQTSRNGLVALISYEHKVRPLPSSLLFVILILALLSRLLLNYGNSSWSKTGKQIRS